MCGYCIEGTALRILSSEMQGFLRVKPTWDAWECYFYLREAPDFPRALDRLRRSLARRREPFYSIVSHSVVLFRGLEILREDGFASPRYQQLLKKHLYREAVLAECAEEARASFEADTEGLAVNGLSILYESDAYLTGKHSEALKDGLLTCCGNLLEHYYSWWLVWDDQTASDTVGYGVKRTLAEDRRCSLLSRAVYFSLLQAPGIPGGKDLLSRIAHQCPAGGPGMSDETLWLQRVAALKFYDLEAPEMFYQHLTSFRASIFEYIDIARGFTTDQKIQLLDEARLYPAEWTTDSLLNITEWLSEELADPARWAKERTAELREDWG